MFLFKVMPLHYENNVFFLQSILCAASYVYVYIHILNYMNINDVKYLRNPKNTKIHFSNIFIHSLF